MHTWSSERSVHRKTQRKQSQEIHIPVNSCQRGFLKVPTNNFPIGYPLTAREAGKCSLAESLGGKGSVIWGAHKTEQAGTVCKRGKDDFRVNLGDGAWGKLVQMEA